MEATKILVIDDSPVVADTIRDQLSAMDFRAHAVYGAPEARDWLRDNTADLLVVDYSLPGTNGVDLVKDLRDTGISAPALFITGEGDEQKVSEIKASVRRLGYGASFLQKPKGAFSHDELLEATTALVHDTQMFCQVGKMQCLLTKMAAKIEKMPTQEDLESQQTSICESRSRTILNEVEDFVKTKVGKIAGGISKRISTSVLECALREEDEGGEGTIPRTIERKVSQGFVWGRLTKGGLVKTLIGLVVSGLMIFWGYSWRMASRADRASLGVKQAQDQVVFPSLKKLEPLPADIREQSVQVRAQIRELKDLKTLLRDMNLRMGGRSSPVTTGNP